MTQAQSAEEKARLKKQWTELAVKQAQEGRWEEAVLTNRNILSLFPYEPDAFNRLGKALSELGQYTEAREAYTQTLKYSPSNTIAKKNLDRLALLQEVPVKAHIGVDRIDPRLFIEETGKTGVTELINLGTASVLTKVGVGDRVQLHVSGRTLWVRNAGGEVIGQIEPRLANRLINFIEEGNRYAAAILSIENGQVRVIIREEYQHPNMFGRVSFPSQGGGDTIRAYIKDTMLRYDREDEDDLGNDDEYYDGGDETEDMAEIDFEGGSDNEE
ncbi:tetratricopeptide repeat protein [Ktedonosporobacter rubrisoli]|uniref:Tetratricopeptide repeat protein n=1 Tax=Ktedonosporobacter rubrisoli TaxID=2509675 RepID=A0A4P6K324_KTERU|nr:tetratricopeptide repeat protein [Ktedonosporobacter rubrisoli]QBD82637.1 tetratricopeptide repeat protein [Ktedonosporobacter rubrisoli]